MIAARSALAALVAIPLLAAAQQAQAQSSSADDAAARMFDSLFEADAPSTDSQPPAPKRPRRARKPGLVAMLAHNDDTSGASPPYVLVDEFGGVLRYIEPVDGIDLDSQIGRRVTVRHDTGDILLASQLALPRSRRSANPAVQLAQHEEPLPAGEVVGDGMVVPEGSDPVYLDDGIDFDGPRRPRVGVPYTPADPRSRPRFYSRFEYVMWWFNGFNTPALVTTADNTTDAGILPMPGTGFALLDRPTTRILYGGDELLDSAERNGARVTLGTWIGDVGIEGDYTVFGEENDRFFASGVNGDPIISRPFFDLRAPDFLDVDMDTDFDELGPPAENVEFVSFPGSVSGSITVTTRSEFLMAGLHLRLPVCCEDRCFMSCGECVDCCDGVGCGSVVSAGRPARQTDFIIGYRYAELDEYLQVFEDLQPLQTPPDNITVLDRFSTGNVFHGAEVGFVSEWLWRRWSFELLSKLAIGNNNQTVTIFGQTTNDNLTPDPGGLLAQTSNIGTYTRDEFAILPEIGATLGYSITKRARLTAGYSLIYLTPVVRPGDQIDREINSELIPPTAVSTFPLRPEHRFVTSNLYAHGLRFGLHLDW